MISGGRGEGKMISGGKRGGGKRGGMRSNIFVSFSGSSPSRFCSAGQRLP